MKTDPLFIMSEKKWDYEKKAFYENALLRKSKRSQFWYSIGKGLLTSKQVLRSTILSSTIKIAWLRLRFGLRSTKSKKE